MIQDPWLYFMLILYHGERITYFMKKVKAPKPRRKNFFPTLILIIVFWTITIVIIGFTEPDLIKDLIIPNSYLIFFLSLFGALFFTLSILLVNSRRGFLISGGIILFLILRLYRLGNLLNLVLVGGLTLALDYYFTQKH